MLSDAIGVVTGCIGAITGVAAVVISIVSYRKTNQIKALDLRLELRKGISDLHHSLHLLGPTLAEANSSRLAVLSATGLGRSGNRERWIRDHADFVLEYESLRASVPPEAADHNELQPSDLEQALVDLHALKVRAHALSEKCRASIAADDEQRRLIREAANLIGRH